MGCSARQGYPIRCRWRYLARRDRLPAPPSRRPAGTGTEKRHRSGRHRNACQGRAIRPSRPPRRPAVLEQAQKNGIDLVVIDTPAKAEQSALDAARAADLVIVPCRPSKFDTDTVKTTLDILKLADSKPAFALLNAIPATGERHEKSFEDIIRLGLPVCPHTVGNRVSFKIGRAHV